MEVRIDNARPMEHLWTEDDILYAICPCSNDKVPDSNRLPEKPAKRTVAKSVKKRKPVLQNPTSDSEDEDFVDDGGTSE